MAGNNGNVSINLSNGGPVGNKPALPCPLFRLGAGVGGVGSWVGNRGGGR